LQQKQLIEVLSQQQQLLEVLTQQLQLIDVILQQQQLEEVIRRTYRSFNATTTHSCLYTNKGTLQNVVRERDKVLTVQTILSIVRTNLLLL